MPARDMEGKIALVGAGSRGLGNASARAIAQRGAKVGICSRDGDSAAAAAEAIAREAGVETWHCSADVSTAEGVKRFVQGGVDHFGGLDVLVSNAGGPPRGVFDDFDDADWQKTFDLNVMSAIRFSREAIPHMRARGGGRLIYILSASVREPIPDLLLSNVMRPAVAGLSKTLSRALGKDNILCNVIAPGTILTDRVRTAASARAEKRGTSLEQELAGRATEIPLGRLGEPSELGALVAFLASPEASYLTGGVYPVDGGRLHGI